MKKNRARHAYQEGFDAQQLGKSIRDCPYSLGDGEFDWERGFTDARRLAKAATEGDFALRKAQVIQQFHLRRARYMRVNDHISKVWEGYRLPLLASDYEAAKAYVLDMPNTSVRILALHYINATEKAGGPNARDEENRPRNPAYAPLLAKRKARAHALSEEARKQHFAGLDDLTETWSGVDAIIAKGDFERAFEYIEDMPDSSSKTMLFMKIMDAQKAAPNRQRWAQKSI